MQKTKLSQTSTKTDLAKLFSGLSGLTIIILLSSFIFGGCAIEKRRYSSGYYIPMRSKNDVQVQKDVHKQNQEDLSISKTKNSGSENTRILTGAPVENETKNFVTPFNEANGLNSKAKHTASVRQEFDPKSFETPKIVSKSNSEPTKSKKLPALKGLSDGQELSAMALAGFICSLVGFLFFLIFGFPFFLALLGIIFSGIGFYQTFKGGKVGKGFAIAGLAVGLVTMILGWIWLIFIGSLFAALL
jgi:preprotein translocase subunit SecF